MSQVFDVDTYVVSVGFLKIDAICHTKSYERFQSRFVVLGSPRTDGRLLTSSGSGG